MTRNILSEIKMLSIGVALGADTHEPEILTPEYLSENRIVPEDFNVQHSMSLPGDTYSQIIYDDRIFLQLNEDVLKITEKCTSESNDVYDSFGIALNCLEKMKSPYHTVGLNMTMYLPDQFPSAWIGDEFYSVADKFACFPNVEFTSADFRFPLSGEFDESTLFMEFNAGQINHKERGVEPSVIINISIILQSKLRHKQRERIENWHHSHSLIREHLERLFPEG